MRTLSRSFAVLCGVFTLFPLAAPAQHAVGVAVERRTAAHVFDPDTLQITASIPLPGVGGDVVIAPDLSEAYVANFFPGLQIHVIDLEKSPPALADGINPIPVTGRKSDVDLTADGRFLLAAGDSLSVVDVQNRSEVSNLSFTPKVPHTVAVGPDGSVLVMEVVPGTQSTEGNVHRYRLDETGNLIHTGDSIDLVEIGGVNNLLVPSYPHLPGFLNEFLSRHTLYISRIGGMTFGSLRNHGLTTVDTVTTTYPTGIDIAFDPIRSFAYARTIDRLGPGPASPGGSQIEGYVFNPLTGRIGPRIVSIALDRRAGTLEATEQIAIDPHTRRLFVAGMGPGGGVRVYDSITGTHLGTVTDPVFMRNSSGVAVRRAAKPWPFH